MRAKLVNFGLFQVVWFVCVMGAGAGRPWVGPLAAALLLPLNLLLTNERSRELRLWVFVLVVGAAAESALMASGTVEYAAQPHGWPAFIVPPWILALWVAFASLLRQSLAWLGPRLRLAAVLGAVGGPLSFLSGEGLGAVDVAMPLAGLVLLALEWALLTPLFLSAAHR